MSPIPMYEAVYNCPEHGDFTRPTTETGHSGDTMKCPTCKKPMPLIRTAPFREHTFGGRVVLRGKHTKDGT